MLRIVHEHCNDCVEATITTTDPLCFNSNDGISSITIDSNEAAYQIIWPDSSGGSVNANQTGGKHIVWVKDTAGCKRAFFYELNAPDSIELTFLTNPSTGGFNNGTATAIVKGGTPPYDYLWDDPQGQSSASATALFSGTYTVMVTDAQDCLVSNTVFVDLETAVVSTELDDDHWHIYPNPAWDFLFAKNAIFTENIVDIAIYNLQGQLKKTKRMADANSGLKISVSGLPAGIYFLKIKSEKHAPFIRKFMRM